MRNDFFKSWIFGQVTCLRLVRTRDKNLVLSRFLETRQGETRQDKIFTNIRTCACLVSWFCLFVVFFLVAALLRQEKLQNVHFSCRFFPRQEKFQFFSLFAYLWVSLTQRWQRSTVTNYFIQCYCIYQGCCRHTCIYVISCPFSKKLKSWSYFSQVSRL